jgi:hypothetical protein
VVGFDTWTLAFTVRNAATNEPSQGPVGVTVSLTVN